MTYPFIPTHTNLAARRETLMAKLQHQRQLQQCQAAAVTLVSLKRVTHMLMKGGW